MPEAPPTESRASTSGTPAENMVASVLVQRAIAALRSSDPKIGILNLVFQALGWPLQVDISTLGGVAFVQGLYHIPFVYLFVAAALHQPLVFVMVTLLFIAGGTVSIAGMGRGCFGSFTAASTPSGFPRVDNVVQRARDDERRRVLQTELRQAEDRLGPNTPAAEAFRYFTAFPPLTSTGHLKRLEAASSVSPADNSAMMRGSLK